MVNKGGQYNPFAEDRGEALDPGVLRKAAEARRKQAPAIPIGIGIGPDPVAADVRAAAEAGLDFVTLHAMHLSERQDPAGWIELGGLPRNGVLTEAVATLRAMGREKDLDLIYFG